MGILCGFLTKSLPSAELKYLVMVCCSISLLGSVTMWREQKGQVVAVWKEKGNGSSASVTSWCTGEEQLLLISSEFDFGKTPQPHTAVWCWSGTVSGWDHYTRDSQTSFWCSAEIPKGDGTHFSDPRQIIPPDVENGPAGVPFLYIPLF